MENEELKIYEWLTKIESKIDSIDVRMEIFEEHQKQYDKKIDKFVEDFTDHKITFKENVSDQKLQYSQLNLLKDVQEKHKKILHEHDKRLHNLESYDARVALSLWKKIGGLVLTGIITAILGYILGKIGGTK